MRKAVTKPSCRNLRVRIDNLSPACGHVRTSLDCGSHTRRAVPPPGHDAWVVGDEPCVFIHFSGMEQYATA
jgi:hypothetical protein